MDSVDTQLHMTVLLKERVKCKKVSEEDEPAVRELTAGSRRRRCWSAAPISSHAPPALRRVL